MTRRARPIRTPRQPLTQMNEDLIMNTLRTWPESLLPDWGVTANQILQRTGLQVRPVTIAAWLRDMYRRGLVTEVRHGGRLTGYRL